MMQQQRPRVLLADDHPGMHVAVGQLLAPTCDVVANVTDCDRLLEAAARMQPDVIVVDLGMMALDSVEYCSRIRVVAPLTRLVVYSVHDVESVRERMLEAGAAAYVSKTQMNDLLAAVQNARGDQRDTSDVPV